MQIPRLSPEPCLHHTVLPGDADAGWRLGGTPTCGVQRGGGGLQEQGAVKRRESAGGGGEPWGSKQGGSFCFLEGW